MELIQNEQVKQIVGWMLEKKAEDIMVINVKGIASYTDYIIVAQGSVEIHNRAIADHVIDMAKQNKIHLLSKEGLENGVWVLLDFADIIIHIFNEKTREYYNLEHYWKELNAEIYKIEKDL